MDSPEKTFKMVSVEKPLDVDIETKVKLYQNVLDNDDSEEERPVDNDQDNNSDKPDTSPKVKYVIILRWILRLF